MPSVIGAARPAGARVVYVSAGAVHDEMIFAIQARTAAGVPQQVPQRRRAADRRHPVPGRQGEHAGEVLPHLQALRDSRQQIVVTAAKPPKDIPMLGTG